MEEHEVSEHDRMDEVKREALRLEALKKQKAEIEAEIVDIEKYLDKTVETGVTFDDDDQIVTVTVVRSTVDRFDEHLISTRYVDIWRNITRRVLDKELYKDAVRTGHITPELHALFHHPAPRKSYVRITRYDRGGHE